MDLSPANDPPTIEQIKSACRERIAKIFSEALPEIANGMVDLAKNSELDTVKFRASARILDEFSSPVSGKFQSAPGTNVQIINAIPFERAAYIGNREVEQVEIGNLRVATPKYKSVTPASDEEERVRKSFAAGKRQQAKELDTRNMKSIGGPVDSDPVTVPIKSMPPKLQ